MTHEALAFFFITGLMTPEVQIAKQSVSPSMLET